MREREAVLKEFDAVCETVAERAMADEIVRLRKALANHPETPERSMRVTDAMVEAMGRHVYQYTLTTQVDIRAGLTAALEVPRDE
jgi:hypothetical protein